MTNAPLRFLVKFDFPDSRSLEATTYAVEDDGKVYFSIDAGGKTIYQNALPRSEFYRLSVKAWNLSPENDA